MTGKDGARPKILVHPWQIPLVSPTRGTRRRGIGIARGWVSSLKGKVLGNYQMRQSDSLWLRVLGAGHWLSQALISEYNVSACPTGVLSDSINSPGLQWPHWKFRSSFMERSYRGVSEYPGFLSWHYPLLCLYPKYTHECTHTYYLYTVYLSIPFWRVPSLSVSIHFVKVKNAYIMSSCNCKINMYIAIKWRKMFYKIRMQSEVNTWGVGNEKNIVPQVYFNWIFVAHIQLAKDATNKMRDKAWLTLELDDTHEIYFLYALKLWYFRSLLFVLDMLKSYTYIRNWNAHNLN